MAIKVSEAARGNAPATGMPKTPAPTRSAPPDAVSEIRKPTAQSYGENGPTHNASRTNPGEFVESDLAANMRDTVGDDVLTALQQSGARALHGAGDWQTRAVDPSRNVPVHSGTRGASAGPKVPDKLGQSAAEPVRKPGA